MKKIRILLFFALVAVAAMLTAQVTTSSMSGKITDGNESLIGATVQAVHTPSGTNYGTVTNPDGRFTIQGMRPGGPYTITVSYVGYVAQQFKDITISLGETYSLNAALKESSASLTEVMVMGTATKFTTEKTGATTNINNEQMQLLPSISRSISDIARISPYANGIVRR